MLQKREIPFPSPCGIAVNVEKVKPGVFLPLTSERASGLQNVAPKPEDQEGQPANLVLLGERPLKRYVSVCGSHVGSRKPTPTVPSCCVECRSSDYPAP